jgi:hypothetical protein
VLVATPQGPNDADVVLVTRYKNFAALDGLGGKFDNLATQLEGSVDKANAAQVSRAKIRTFLGSQILQTAELK